jgi:hypothetical protein
LQPLQDTTFFYRSWPNGLRLKEGKSSIMVHPRFEGEMNGLQNDVFLKLKNQTVVDLQAANVCDKICCASSTSRFFQSEHQFRTLTNFRKWPIIFEDLWCLTAGPSTSSTSGKNPENPDCNMGGYEGLVTATWAVTSILVTAHVVTRVFRDCSPT